MESLRHRSAVRTASRTLILCLAALFVLLVLATPADARRRYTTTAKTDNGGVDFSIKTMGDGGASTTVRSGGVSCSYELQFGNIGIYSGYWKDSPPDTTLARKTCTDGTDEFVWVYVGDMEAPPRVDPETLAREARDRLPVPGIRISANPGRGLVGLESWFWLEGGGQPLTGSLARFGVRVDVQADPVSFEWDFGDGTVKTTRSAGRPYPQRSGVTHVYERSSAEFERGYHVVVTTVFDVRWRANRGRWRTLPGISRTSGRFYSVAESQTVNSDG